MPAAYGGEHGPDLDFVAQYCGLSPAEGVRIHSGGEYPVYFLGFTPGFPYLGGLDPRLSTPRLATPRTRVPAGRVGIAGPQTGIYSVDSPYACSTSSKSPPPCTPPAMQSHSAPSESGCRSNFSLLCKKSVARL